MRSYLRMKCVKFNSWLRENYFSPVMAARALRGKSHFCLQEKQIKLQSDDCTKYFSCRQDRQFPPVCPCHWWKLCTKYECVYNYMRVTEGWTHISSCRPQWHWPGFLSYKSCDVFIKEHLVRSIVCVTSCPLQWFHITSESHPAFYSTDIGTFYSRVKRPKHADHLRLA